MEIIYKDIIKTNISYILQVLKDHENTYVLECDESQENILKVNKVQHYYTFVRFSR